MLIYAKVLSTLALVAGTFMFGVPLLVSQANTLLVLAGFAVLAAVPVVVYYIWETEIGKGTSKLEEARKARDDEDDQESAF